MCANVEKRISEGEEADAFLFFEVSAIFSVGIQKKRTEEGRCWEQLMISYQRLPSPLKFSWSTSKNVAIMDLEISILPKFPPKHNSKFQVFLDKDGNLSLINCKSSSQLINYLICVHKNV